MGLDLGGRRIGVAVSDGAGMLATPRTTLARSGDRGRDHRALAEVVAEVGARRVVVGLPLSLDGTRGPAAVAVATEAEALGATLGLPVELVDERLSTIEAQRSLRGAGVAPGRRRHVVDAAAATVILQAWLDRRRGRGPQPPPTEEPRP